MAKNDKVTSRDLAGFDKEARKMILDAQERGARVRISNRNHALLYGPNGTTAIARKTTSSARSANNGRAAIERILREEPTG